MLLMLYTHAHDDGATVCHHQVNTIKGDSSFLFTIGNADFELTTCVILSVSEFDFQVLLQGFTLECLYTVE